MIDKRLTGCLVGTILAWTTIAGAGGRSGQGVQDTAIVRVSAGVAALSGIVLSEDPAGRPVRRATVRVTGEHLRRPHVVGTDDDGRFVIRDLPAGPVAVSAAKPGYIEAYHGSTRPGLGPGIPVALTTGETTDVVLRIVPGGVITGTVVDAFGRVAPSVPVLAAGIAQGPAGQAVLQRTTTDDRGEYRIFGLPPGDYLVVAQPTLHPRGAAFRAVPAGELLWTANAAAPTGLSAAPSVVTYAPVYYPGTTNLAAAAPVAVEVGRETSGVGVALQLAPVARLSGQLVDRAGRPVSPASVAVYPRWKQQLSVTDRLAALGALKLPRVASAASSFSLAGLAPGDYTLVARSGSATVRASTEPTPVAERLWGYLDVTVTGPDQSDLVILLEPGISVSGRVVFEGSSAPEEDEWWHSFRLGLVGTNVSSRLALTAAAVVEHDGTVRFESVAPGQYSLQAHLSVSARNAGWSLKSALLDGRDIADWPLVIEPGTLDRRGLEITFTDRPAAISGHLLDAAGRPETRYSIVVITTDQDLWIPNSRRIRSVRPATDGSFRVDGLPPGGYAIAAVRDVDLVDLGDRAFLARLAEAGYSLTLEAGATLRQDLRVAFGGLDEILNRVRERPQVEHAASCDAPSCS